MERKATIKATKQVLKKKRKMGGRAACDTATRKM